MTGGEINVSEERDFVTFLYVRRLQSIKEQKKKKGRAQFSLFIFIHQILTYFFLPLPPLKDVRERIHTRAHTLDTHIAQTLVGR